MKSKNLLRKAFLALALTLVMGVGLFFNSMQASALEVTLSNPSPSSSVTAGTPVTFDGAIRFTNPNEIVPISSLELVLTGPSSHVISFGPLSLAATGSTSVLSVPTGPHTAFGAGYGYAFGYCVISCVNSEGEGVCARC